MRMDELKIGDYVLSIHPTTHKPVYSKVYLWAHRDPHITATFIHITHPHGHLHISANHLILTGDNNTPVPAHQLTVGDTIHFLSQQNNHNKMEKNKNKNKKKKEGERRFSFTHLSTCLTHTHVYTSGVLHSIHQQRTHCGGQHSNQCVLSLLYSLSIRDQLLVVSHSD